MRFLFESNVTLALGSLALLLNSSVHRQSRRMRWRGRLRHGQEHLVKTIPTKCYHYIRTTLSSGVCSVRSVRLAGSLQGSAGPQGRVRRDQLTRVYDCDTAVNTGYYTFSYVKDGETKSLPARYSFTYVKRGDAWLIVDHHSSAVPSVAK